MAALTRIAWSCALQRVHLCSSKSKIYISTALRYQECYAKQHRFYSAPPQRKGFISQIVENIKEDINKNKEMKEKLKLFREEREKFEQSEALQKARQKYKLIEKETSRSSEQIKEQIVTLKDKIKEGIEEAQKSEFAVKGREFTEELTKSAKVAAEAIAKQGEHLGKSTPIRAVAEGVKTVKEQIEEVHVIGARVYQPPKKLRKRKEMSEFSMEDKIVEPNSSATGVELHKDSKWYQSWQNFKDNNQYVNKIFDLKMRYDESDNPVVRVSRVLTDKVSDIFSGLFQTTEISEVLTEIVKMDPNFEKEKFIRECEFDIIPNILEAMIRGDLEILRDWCYEAVFNMLSTSIKQAHSLGYHFDSRILDINNVDLIFGKIMEQGPVLAMSFQTQQILAVRDSSGNVIEGDPDKVQRLQYVFVLCRDPSELDPKAAWKLLELTFSSMDRFL